MTPPGPPRAELARLENAVVMPVEEDRDLPHGVYQADGAFCALSRTMLSGGRLSAPPAPPAPDRVGDLAGRFVFGGIARLHFGHFLVETITRLWALDHIGAAPPDAVLFLPMPGKVVARGFENRFKPLIAALLGDVPYLEVTAPTRVGHLVVPSQGMGHIDWNAGTPEFRAFMRDRLETRFQVDGPENLYISRSRLEGADKLFDQEARLEDLMRGAGYTVFHPQEHSIDVQCAHYMAARRIVGADGSAFHLAAFVMQPGTRVGLIQRRHRAPVFRAIANQITAFSQVDLATLHPLMAATPDIPTVPVNFTRLERALRHKGFL